MASNTANMAGSHPSVRLDTAGARSNLRVGASSLGVASSLGAVCNSVSFRSRT